MHFIHGQTHSGTRASSTYKYAEEGPDVGAMPLESHLGEAVACNFTRKKGGEAITTEDFQQAGDIVLAWGSVETADNTPCITVEAIDWLIETKIEILGLENIHYSPPGTPLGPGDSDCKLLLAGIPMVDALLGINQIQKQRVFFIALRVKLRRVAASWARVIALEERDD